MARPERSFPKCCVIWITVSMIWTTACMIWTTVWISRISFYLWNVSTWTRMPFHRSAPENNRRRQKSILNFDGFRNPRRSDPNCWPNRKIFQQQKSNQQNRIFLFWRGFREMIKRSNFGRSKFTFFMKSKLLQNWSGDWNSHFAKLFRRSKGP